MHRYVEYKLFACQWWFLYRRDIQQQSDCLQTKDRAPKRPIQNPIFFFLLLLVDIFFSLFCVSIQPRSTCTETELLPEALGCKSSVAHLHIELAFVFKWQYKIHWGDDLNQQHSVRQQYNRAEFTSKWLKNRKKESLKTVTVRFSGTFRWHQNKDSELKQ